MQSVKQEAIKTLSAHPDNTSSGVGDEDMQEKNEAVSDTIAEKHRHVLLLKKLLEQRLRNRLKKDKELVSPSP